MPRTLNAGPVVQYRGEYWQLVEVHRTSDGYRIGTGLLLDPDTLEPANDDLGLPTVHDFFLGGN